MESAWPSNCGRCCPGLRKGQCPHKGSSADPDSVPSMHYFMWAFFHPYFRQLKSLRIILVWCLSKNTSCRLYCHRTKGKRPGNVAQAVRTVTCAGSQDRGKSQNQENPKTSCSPWSPSPRPLSGEVYQELLPPGLCHGGSDRPPTFIRNASQHKNFCPQRTKCIWFKLANSDPLLCLICWLQHCPHFPLSCKYNKNFFTRRSKYSLEVQGFKYKDILAATPTKTHAGVYLSQMLVKVKALADTISNVLMFTFTFLMFPWTDMLPSSFYLQFSTCHPLKFNTLKDFLLLNTTLITSIHSELGPGEAGPLFLKEIILYDSLVVCGYLISQQQSKPRSMLVSWCLCVPSLDLMSTM